MFDVFVTYLFIEGTKGGDIFHPETIRGWRARNLFIYEYLGRYK